MRKNGWIAGSFDELQKLWIWQ